MRPSALSMVLTSLILYSCNNNVSNEKHLSICVAYRPLSSICLLEERDSVKVAYRGQVQEIYDGTDCILSLPSVFHKGHEFIPVAYLHYNDANLLVKATVNFTLGNNPDIDTTGIRSKLMQSFNYKKNIHHSYNFDHDTSRFFKSFSYQLK
jgi:hypothetical protein